MRRDATTRLAALGAKVGAVPCAGCVYCCLGDAVRLLPGDDVSTYKTEPHFALKGELMLAHNSDGNCVYLTEGGCGIWERRPIMCREMDCRLLTLTFSWTEANKLNKEGMLKITVWRKGKDLLKVLRGEQDVSK